LFEKENLKYEKQKQKDKIYKKKEDKIYKKKEDKIYKKKIMKWKTKLIIFIFIFLLV
jgi:uncharacterized membrane protein